MLEQFNLIILTVTNALWEESWGKSAHINHNLAQIKKDFQEHSICHCLLLHSSDILLLFFALKAIFDWYSRIYKNFKISGFCAQLILGILMKLQKIRSNYQRNFKVSKWNQSWKFSPHKISMLNWTEEGKLTCWGIFINNLRN